MAAWPGFDIVYRDADGSVTPGPATYTIPVQAPQTADLTVANIPRSASSLGSGRVVRLARAQIEAADALILTKGLGVGIYSAAIKKGALDQAGIDEMVTSTTLLNRAGADLAEDGAVHALTDVTGFGILGHGLEVARGSGARVVIDRAALPLLTRAAELAQAGFVTGASTRNWAAYGAEVTLPDGTPDWQRHLLTDPQTSGGLLVAVSPEAADAVLALIRDAGLPLAAIIGRAEEGPAGIVVT